MTNVRAAVFASGSGSNFQAIMEETNLPIDVVLLVCDRSDAGVIAKAEKFGVEPLIFNPKAYAGKEDYERLIVEKLRGSQVEWLFLAGYMRIVGSVLLTNYAGRMINIHPSLLPDFPGKDAIGQAYTAGVETTGVTVHYVDAGIDTGPVIAQQEVPVHPDDTKETLTKRIQQVEHNLYPTVIRQLLEQEDERGAGISRNSSVIVD
ncbi:phosphoribosylglycinamide formyltransferase [Lentibacillus cibarius]|uniref:Phosphoribosylglycinamide formyltransferase n=1 Tax=Lentibacillus cibarius TaxID=2583219 RepID=A0A549YI64_9BACI|nr:phosphoribosylglycinamide formyltransferase [Lentibacillus cibarius]TRM11568.1 phosphoribosylglycinamide formyltransferase [Lentibacillus cibarius]